MQSGRLSRSILKTGLSFILLLGMSGCFDGKKSGEMGDDTDKVFSVRRSDLIIGTLLRGAANAKKKHKLFPEATYKNTLIWIADENSYVKEGDVVIRFETQTLVEDIEARRLTVETKQKTLDIKNEEKRVILSENMSARRIAEDAVETAEEAYARYYKYDGKKARDDKVAAVEAQERSYEEQQTAYQDQQDKISNTIYDSEDDRQKAISQLDKMKVELESREQKYDDAVYGLRIFKKYTYPNTLMDKENKLFQARLNLEKTLVSTASKVVQKENDIHKIENELRKAKKELARLEEYLPMMEIKAPADGVLVYGDIDGRRDRKIEIQVGMDVTRKRVMATIPEMDNLIVNFELPEQFLHRFGVGARAIVTPDAIPSLKVSGEVSEIALVPVNQISWDRTSPKVYHSVLTLDEQNSSFVSGMNVQVEVIEETIKDAVNIPVEAVFEEEGEYYVFLVSGGKARKHLVQLGKSNDRYVHIPEGLSEGDGVYLYSPFELEAME